LANDLKSIAKKQKLTITELLKPIVENYASEMNGRKKKSVHKDKLSSNSSGSIYTNERTTSETWDEIEEPLDFEKLPDYWKDFEQKKTIQNPRIPWNAPCPCGASHPDGKPKKYKHCCGKVK
jgi:uncharacterized protein YchJ